MTQTANLMLTLLEQGQLQPEVTINNDLQIIDSLAGPAIQFGYKQSTTTGLTFGYYGGRIYSNGANITIADGTLTLAASATNYVQRTAAGVVSSNTTGYTVGLIPMATVVTGAASITTVTDTRPATSDLRGRQVIQVGAPTGVGVATSTTGGTLAAATYGYRVSAVYPWGESAASAEVTVTTTGTTSENTISWTLPSQATAAKVYGRTSGGELLIATVAAGTSSYLDTGSVTPSGALPTGSLAISDAQVNTRILSFQGTLGGNTVVNFPTYQQEWIVSHDAVAAGFTLQVQATGSSAPVTLTQGASSIVYGNGSTLKSSESRLLQESDLFGDFIVSGIIGAPITGLAMTLPAGVAYVLGQRTTPAAYAFTYAASSDSYVDLSPEGIYTVASVANGGAAPALTTGAVRTQIVVTNATDVTGVTQILSSTPSFSSPISAPNAVNTNEVVNLEQLNSAVAPSALLASIKTVDGAGSGLDADLLDAQSGAYYLSRANHTGTQLLATISDAGSAASQTADAAATPNTVPLRDASGRMKTAAAAAADDALAQGQLLDGSLSPVVNAFTAQGPLTQNPGAGANNSTPLAQYGDLFSDAIVSGLTTATSATLTGDLSSGVAYVLGQRVAYAGGSYTVAASATSYLDLSTTGVLTVTTSATVTANSLRLWSVTSDASTITTVTQIAENYVTLLGMSVGGGTSTNVFIGYQALLNNTTGVNNVANGYLALLNNTTGGYNVANGYHALLKNTTGNRNVANGYQALYSNTTAGSNVANGVQALFSNTTGGSNVANGGQALFSNTTGGSNVANGVQALYSNTTGNRNVANGVQAGYSNVSGSGSVFIGYLAGYNETLPDKLYISNSGTANPLIYGDFAAGYLRFNGSIASTIGPVLSAINLGSTTTAGNITLTAAQLKSSYFTDSATQTAAFTITTDTAANLLAELPAAAVGSSFTFRFFNNDQSATGFAGTLAAGAGITISTALPNPAVAKGTWADYLFAFTNVTTGSEAVTVSYIGRGTI